jgi:hypothetical protein
MWYKFAKQGSVWSRIAPDAEAQFDTLLDQATYVSYGTRYIDIKTLNEVFQKSNFKDVVVNFVEAKMHPMTNGEFSPALIKLVRKLSFLKKYIPNFFRDSIKLNSENFQTLPYHRQISLIKHEFAHVISSYTIPDYDSSLYMNSGSFTGSEIGNSIQETNENILVKNIRKNLSSLNKYLSIVFGRDIEDYYYETNVSYEVFERELKEVWQLFIQKIKNQEITVPKEIMQIINEINNDNFNKRIRITNPHIDFNLKKPEDYEKIHKTLQERAKLLGTGFDRDLYAANPEETLAHIVNMQHLFSIRLLREYFSHLFQTGVYNSVDDPKKQFLEDIKIMFNYLIGITDETAYTTTSSWTGYQNPREYADHFLLGHDFETFLIKINDQKFKEQVAKHLNNVYQQLKQEFSVETGSFKDLNENPSEENLSDQNKKEGE